VIPIEVPALRDRREDIPELVEHFLRSVRAQYPASPVERLTPEAVQELTRYTWPGNVRELAHTIERLVLLGQTPLVSLGDVPEAIRRGATAGATEFAGEIMPMHELERRYAAWAVGQTGGHRGRAAEKLEIDPKTLRKWLDSGE